MGKEERNKASMALSHASQLAAVVVVDGNNMAFTLDFLSDDGEDAGSDEDGVVGAYPIGECDARNRLLSIANNDVAHWTTIKPIDQ